MRILLADEQRKVRFALRVLLERHSGHQVIAEATDADGLLAQVEVACPDVVLLSWELPGNSDQDLIAKLRCHCPGTTVIALSGRLSAHQAALAAGADAFVSKGKPPEQLMAAISHCCPELGTPQPSGS
jgi:two-component system phosphate regulon response regulator PhoB